MLDISQYRLPADAVRAMVEHSLQSAEWNLPIDHWSPSSFSMLRRCPYQWQQRYLHGRKERPAEAPVMGTAVHAALERNFAQKIDTHTDLALPDLLEWYLDEGFSRVVYEEQEKASEEILWDTGPEATRQRGKFVVASYHDAVAPRIQPLKVETKFAVDFGLDVPVEGRFDLERDTSCIDFKTGKQSVKKPKEDWRIQAAIYTEATNKPVEFHSLAASAKTNSVTIVTPLESEEMLLSPSQRERDHMRRTVKAISAEACMYMAKYGPDEDWPTHGRFHTWACGFCGFRPGCPAWKEN
jgi:RecB family exonuclease